LLEILGQREQQGVIGAVRGQQGQQDPADGRPGEDLHIDQRRSAARGDAVLGGEEQREGRRRRGQADPRPGRPPRAAAEDQRQDNQEQGGRERRNAGQVETLCLAR
jgi:hypothetical protein